jgi:NAD(P)-dependent dehydrogenase (short-subunit alcohol dehydrogenase family)
LLLRKRFQFAKLPISPFPTSMIDTRKILITGVSQGLGKALLRGFYQLGHSVAGGARNQQKLSSLAQDLPNAWLAPVDVADRASVHAWSQRVLAEWGTPDLLIHAAATIHPNGFLSDLQDDDIERVLDTNIKGTFYINRAFFPAMREANRGVIVNISSGAGRMGLENMTAYCASKWAVEGLTAALATEITVGEMGLVAVTLSPGLVNTSMLQSCFGQTAAQYATPDQWAANAVPFLLQISKQHNGRQLTVTA